MGFWRHSFRVIVVIKQTNTRNRVLSNPSFIFFDRFVFCGWDGANETYLENGRYKLIVIATTHSLNKKIFQRNY